MTDADHINLLRDDRRPGHVHAPLDDEHAALSAGGEKRAARPVQVRRVRDRVNVRAAAEGASQMRTIGLTIAIGRCSAPFDSPIADRTAPRCSRRAAQPATQKPARQAGRRQAGRHSAHGGWPARFPGQLDQRHDHAARAAAPGHAAGDHRGSGAATMKPTPPRRSSAREAPSNPDRGAPPVGGELRKSPNAEPTYLERAVAGRRRHGGRLQLVLDRSGRSRAARRRPAAQLDPDRSAERPRARLHRAGARAHGEGGGGAQGAGLRVRSSRAAAATPNAA